VTGGGRAAAGTATARPPASSVVPRPPEDRVAVEPEAVPVIVRTYPLRRCALLSLVLFGVSVITFMPVRVEPSDPPAAEGWE